MSRFIKLFTTLVLYLLTLSPASAVVIQIGSENTINNADRWDYDLYTYYGLSFEINPLLASTSFELTEVNDYQILDFATVSFNPSDQDTSDFGGYAASGDTIPLWGEVDFILPDIETNPAVVSGELEAFQGYVDDNYSYYYETEQYECGTERYACGQSCSFWLIICWDYDTEYCERPKYCNDTQRIVTDSHTNHNDNTEPDTKISFLETLIPFGNGGELRIGLTDVEFTDVTGEYYPDEDDHRYTRTRDPETIQLQVMLTRLPDPDPSDAPAPPTLALICIGLIGIGLRWKISKKS
ncbi:MAG: hypothetical protein ABW120_03740 [Sedimenticola sp.]